MIQRYEHEEIISSDKPSFADILAEKEKEGWELAGMWQSYSSGKLHGFIKRPVSYLVATEPLTVEQMQRLLEAEPDGSDVTFPVIEVQLNALIEPTWEDVLVYLSNRLTGTDWLDISSYSVVGIPNHYAVHLLVRGSVESFFVKEAEEPYIEITVGEDAIYKVTGGGTVVAIENFLELKLGPLAVNSRLRVNGTFYRLIGIERSGQANVAGLVVKLEDSDAGGN